MQIQDNNRADKSGSKARVPAPTGSSARRTHVGPPPAEDALAVNAPPTDDTPTIISRHGPATPATATEPADNGIRGRRLAHFELIEPIGVGGMAAVLRARDSQLDRFVALKILPPEMAADAENVRRFHQEARSAARLDHENVARVFFCGEDQRLHFIAFEFVEGENLRTILERRGRLPVAEALNYVLQVAAGLAHAAARGVVHRDVKPSNIIITPSGRAKLVDMGLARTMEPTGGNPELTQSGVTLGTFDYISPEQALEPRDADVRSDIYSLGCTFYHLLTGRTPTPEGTAAKKLHCHQHVNPVDPRHYVPDLPLDVVQILDRMMAKKPADRFQTPEELVQRLLRAAKALGIHSEAPEGAVAVEAVLPPSRGRPLLWAALAAAAVVALVFFLDPLSNGPAPVVPVKPQPGDKDGPPAKDAPRLVKDGPDKTQQPAPADVTPVENVYRSPERGGTAQDLIAWLAQRQNADRIELYLKGDLQLTPANGAAQCLLVQAREKVIIRPLDPKSRPTIRLTYDNQPGNRPLVALTVACPDAEIEGVRFVVDGAQIGDVEMAALHLRAGKHKVQRCEFVQVQPFRDERNEFSRHVASLVAESGRRGKDEVSVKDCVFLGFGRKGDGTDTDDYAGADVGGRDAVVRRGPVRIDVSGCVFGPHAAAFRLEGDGGDDSHKLSVKNCTVLLPAARSAAFELPAKASGHLDVTSCLFSRLDLTPADADGAVVIRQDEEQPSAVTFAGSDNVYHDLDGYWAVGDGWRKAGWETFRTRNSNGRVVLAWPWAATPKAQVEALDAQKVREALQLNHRLAGLRKGGQPAADYVGAETVLGDRLVSSPPRAADDRTDPPPPRVLLVEQDGKDSANGIYAELHLAVQSARPGDVILIRHDGRLAVKPIHLTDKATSRLTIKPARRFRPVLTLGETDEADASLFRVQDGFLRLEGLELRVAPNKTGFRTVSAVTLTGDGDCALVDCAVTLDKTAEWPTPAVLASLLAKPDKEMKSSMKPARKPEEGPLLTLKGTFVRGDGELFSAKTSRPCQLDVSESAIALSGTLVGVTAPGGTEAPEKEPKMAVNLTQSTTYLTGNLVRLNVTQDPRGIVPVAVTAAKCLFVAVGNSNKALIQLDGLGTSAEKFSWKTEESNGYGGYQMMLLQNPGGELMMSSSVPPAKWRTDHGEEGPDKVKLAVQSAEQKPFTQLQPGALARPADKDAEGLGADAAKLRKPAQ